MLYISLILYNCSIILVMHRRCTYTVYYSKSNNSQSGVIKLNNHNK